MFTHFSTLASKRTSYSMSLPPDQNSKIVGGALGAFDCGDRRFNRHNRPPPGTRQRCNSCAAATHRPRRRPAELCDDSADLLRFGEETDLRQILGLSDSSLVVAV